MADCLSLIQSNLETLKTYEKNILSNEGSISDVLKKVKDIYINYSLKKQEREIANAYLLSKESGILSSLKAFLCLKNFRSIKLECFRLLDDIIELSSQHIQEYGEDIQSVCLLYVIRDVPADVKKACLITLSKILEACRGFQGEKRIKPQSLIEELFKLLCRGHKLPSKVKEEVLCLIGIIAHYYPEDFLDYQERVLLMYLQELKTQVKAKAKAPDYYTVAGCLQGLKEYMYNFPPEDEENSYFIFDVARKMAIESEKFHNISASGSKSNTSSSACKAGLQMIAAHASQFSQFVFEDCKNLYLKLMEWVEQDNREMQKLGRDAVIAVLKMTADKIMSDYENDENNCKNIFKFFMEDFREIFLKNSNDNSRKLHIAVIGYGLFAGPCKLCLPESEVKRMLQNIIQKSEYEFFSENKNVNDNIMVLSCYIESVASILSNIDFIPENILFEVEKLVIFQIDKFPKVPSAYHFVIPKSIIHVFVALQPKREIFVEFLSEIVYQGLVRTCSHPIVIEAESMKDKIATKDETESSNNQYGTESNVKIETYKDYMYLWKNILNVVQLKELSALNVTLQERQYLMECIYDQIIRSSLDLISKLDLSLQQQTKQDILDDLSSDDEDDVSSDPLHGIRPNNREDYYIFLNIVEFLKDLLIDSCIELFSKWVYPFGREMIFYATSYSYHSGFYKLISLNLSICRKISYFKGISKYYEFQDSHRVENVVFASFNLFSKFVKEIIVRLQQFKDELLASCLEVLLVLPTEIVLQEIHILISALEIALKLGMSYLPLATNAVSALEQWSDSLPSEKIKPYFPVLLPYLNNYITASGSHDACSIPLIKEAKPSKAVHKMSTKLVKKKKSSLDTVVDDPEFEKLQLKIIKFLGRLGESNSALLENAFENVDKVAIAWDSVHQNHLKYAIPFVDMKPEIYFDDFLPRVLEVALKSSVRQVKVAACETLHSLILYMIGRGSQMPENSEAKFSMEALYKNLFPGMLELACDVEQVAKQLFHPLVFQIIHWFTHSKVIKTPESAMILQALWDGVTHKENASLRDLSAVCLKEYFQWFLKQTPQGKKKLIESMLNKLTSFSLHPSPYKRMGAALTFNNIYKIFRSEEDLIKKYTIQLLVQFVDSLAIAHNDDKSLGTQKQCITALEHIEKIVIVKNKYFLKSPQDAKVPSCLKDSSLLSVTQWLLWQCGCIQTECRHKCMDLVVKLSTLISGINDPVSFLLNYNIDGKNIFEDIFERSLRNTPDLSDLTSFKPLSFWLEALLASLECYHWAFSDSLQLQIVLDGVKHISLLSSIKIFNIASYFLTNIIKETLSSVTHKSVDDSIDVYTPEEELKYNRLKCSVLVRLLSLIPSLFEENANWFHEKFFKILWTPDLWEVLMLCTVHASSIGFDMNDPEIFTNLPKEMCNLHQNCLNKRKDFQEYCRKFLLQKKYYLPKMLPLTFKDTKEDPLRLIQIFTGYEQLILHKLWSPTYSVDITEHELIENILCSVVNISAVKDNTTNRKIVSSPIVMSIAEKLLLVSYALGLKMKKFVKKFAVCSFLDENNAMHVVPSSWILSDHTVKWPKSGSAKSLIDRCLDIKGEWTAKSIKIYSMASTLDSAEKKLDKNLDTSNVSESSSDADAETPEKLFKKRTNDDDDPDVDDPNHRKKYLKTLPESPFERSKSSISNCKKNSRTSHLRSPSQSASINSCEAVEVDNLDESETGQTDSNDPFAIKVFRILVDVQRRIKQLRYEVKENGNKIDKLEEKINSFQGVPPSPNPIIYQPAEYNFPISSTEQLMELEQQLLDAKNANKLCLHLSTRPASSMKQMVLNIIKYLLTRSVALEFNLYGLKDKKKFAGLHICNIIIGAVQIVFKEETTAEIMKRISFVLAGARDWDGERKKRLSNNTVTVQNTVNDLALRLINKNEQDCKDLKPLVFSNYTKNICEFVAKNPSPFIQTLVDNLNYSSFTEISVLLKFIDHVARTKILRKNHGKVVIEAFLAFWSSICSWSNNHPDIDSLYSVFSVMQKMLLIDSEVALNTSGMYSMPLYPSYISLLKKEGISFNFIVQAFNILPFFLESSKNNLRECLEEVIVNHFPLTSTELKPGSSSYHLYISALKKLFTALYLTGCNFLLEILTVLICKEDSHILEDDFKNSIVQMVKRTQLEKQHLFADLIFNMVCKGKCSLKAEILIAILEKVLVPLIQSCKVASFINFYLSHIKIIMTILKGSSITVGEDIKIIKRIYGFRLIEILYGRLSKDLLHTKESQILETYLGNKPINGNELTTEVIKLCIEFKRTSFENEPLHKELYRKLNCVSYNTLIAVVACTQKDLRFYNGILFKIHPVKNERIWERIIDKEKCLKFDVELDSSLQRQKKFVSMRHQMRDNSGVGETDVGEGPSSLQLLGSESLGLSSLAEDASKFVFSTEEQVFNREQDQVLSNNDESKLMRMAKSDKSDINVIELEDDDLNKHECMVSLSWLIKHLKILGLIPAESCEEVAPSWINFLAQSLEDSNSHDNIKLFIGRLIVNNAVVLQPYAKFLLKPLMKLIVSGIPGRELNYYILDVIITLLSWAPSYVPGDTLAYEASELLKFVIKQCDHSRREIFRNNMEVTKTILECWKDVLEIPYDEIYQKMNHPESDSKRNLCGIQLLGVVILCGFPPFDPQEEARGMSYLNILLKNLNHKYKEIHGSAAEVISLVLKNFTEKDKNIEKHPFFIKVVNYLENMMSQKMESNFLYCLNKIHIGCPKIADRFISKLLFLYPSVYGVYANYILEVVCSRVEHIPDAFKALKLIGLFKEMEKKSEPIQFLSLQALEKLIPSLNCDDLLNILPDMVEIHSQPSVQCRLALYKILFVLFENYVNNDGAKEKEITRLAQETLIAGLADPDQSVRLTVDNFWSNEKRLPSSTKERLIALLKRLYSPATEESFLQYATFLLLERTSNSPDYKRKIFEHPLTQCNFQTYQIQVSWRRRNVAMSSPLFTETVSNSLSSSLIMGESFDVSKSGDGNFVKATQQDYDFPETVDSSKVIKSGTYNWLTGESMDTYAHAGPSEESFLGSFSGTTEKSYLYALKGSSKTSAKEIHTVSEAKKKDDKKPEKSAVWMLKRRFWRDRGKSDVFAKQELRRQDRRKEILKEQQSRREAQVVMYRSYRIGELPDIEISNSALIAPIQALAMNDVVIAKLLFKSLVIGVCDYVKEDCPEEYHALLSDVGSCFDKILSTSYMRTPSVISFCLESLNSLQDVSFNAEHVFVASIGSNQQSIGILLLESKILKGFEYEPSTKRKRNDRQAISEERNFWMKLAELYKSLNDYDVVNGIFSLTMGQRKENRKALQYEASGHYFDAYELYNELYENTSDECDQAEKDFWDKSLLSCLDKLTKWESLETVVTERFIEPGASINVLQLIWQDQYVKDNYLPYWIRSKMKLLLNGKQDQALLDFFDDAKKDEENKIHLENFAEDLALLYILQDKFDIARQFSSTCFKKFLKDWQNLSPLAVNMQKANVQNLLKYTELDEFLYLMKNDKFLEMSSTTELLKKWQKRYPSLTDPVNVWDDMSCNRQLYLKKLQSKVGKKTEIPKPRLSYQDSMELCETVDEEFFEFKNVALTTSALTKIHFAENAAEQKNFPVALKNLKDIYKVSKSLDQAIWSKFIQCYCSVNNKRCHSFPEKKLDILLQSLKELGDLEVKCGTTVNAKKLQSQTFELLSEMFIKGEVAISSIKDKQKELFTKFCGSSNQTVSSLLEKSFLCLNEVIAIEKSDKTSSLKNTASAHMALANFCNKYLRKEEDSDINPRSIPSFAKFPVFLTQSLLTALDNGVSEAFLLFPRLLQIIEQYPDSMQTFKQKVFKMPCWLFIGWINQMLALLDKPEASAVQGIIENITYSYPDAIIYAFHLSYENYKFSSTVEGKTNKAFVEKIKRILGKQTLITEFVSALEQLSVPSIIFKDYIDEINQLIHNKATKEELISAFQTMYNNLFDVDERSKSLSFGPVQKKFAKNYKEKILEICGKNGQKLGSSKSSERLATLKLLMDLRSESFAVAKKNDLNNSKLKDYSPWLSNFQSWIYPTQIEIPGQYTGRSKPLPEYHVKISGFDEKIMVLSSITIPRRITIRGNDEKEYKILVKAGEDLRQDARIQQMFSVMNEIFRDDIACKQCHISLKTYQVIPLSNRLGLIEWLDHTAVLQSFMYDGMTDRDKESFCKKRGTDPAKEKFMQWVKKFENFHSLYMTLYKEKSREECVQKFQEIVDSVPKNLLTSWAHELRNTIEWGSFLQEISGYNYRKSFLKLSSSPEAFVALRTRFATSHAALCIAQWILGIGDRHLGNFLVDKSSGYEIGIDFGHAFGSATQFLPVPELMPFRLTPQYLQLLNPLKEKGIYEATMVHTLSALQSKSELLFNVMDIFIKEPTLDWKGFARKQQREWGEQSTDDDDWFPKQRIALARKKLEGVNPSYITREELELGHRSKECFNYMEAVCLGNKEHNVRATYDKTGLGPEEQVDCLIDQATDPHLLCLTYCGWNSWM